MTDVRAWIQIVSGIKARIAEAMQDLVAQGAGMHGFLIESQVGSRYA